MALAEELDITIRKAEEEAAELEAQVDALRREIARRRQIQAQALRLYCTTTGSPHPLEVSEKTERRERPRAEQVLAAMDAFGGPVTLSELVSAMPDGARRGAVSAVVHRAIEKGEVRRLERGVYELVGRYARAS